MLMYICNQNRKFLYNMQTKNEKFFKTRRKCETIENKEIKGGKGKSQKLRCNNQKRKKTRYVQYRTTNKKVCQRKQVIVEEQE